MRADQNTPDTHRGEFRPKIYFSQFLSVTLDLVLHEQMHARCSLRLPLKPGAFAALPITEIDAQLILSEVSST